MSSTEGVRGFTRGVNNHYAIGASIMGGGFAIAYALILSALFTYMSSINAWSGLNTGLLSAGGAVVVVSMVVGGFIMKCADQVRAAIRENRISIIHQKNEDNL